MRQGQGQENPTFRQIFTSLFIPGAAAEQVRWFNDLQRMTTSSENACAFDPALDEIAIAALLPDVRVPTLVLHCRNDAVQPFEEGRRMAAGISGSRFVALEGSNHLILKHEPAWVRLLDEVTRFLGT
jgi:pimeloyl-ACP methyl ester carboxylesterase